MLLESDLSDFKASIIHSIKIPDRQNEMWHSLLIYRDSISPWALTDKVTIHAVINRDIYWACDFAN